MVNILVNGMIYVRYAKLDTRKYAYAIRGEQAIYKEKKLGENLTLTAFISRYGMESFQFFSGGGT